MDNIQILNEDIKQPRQPDDGYDEYDAYEYDFDYNTLLESNEEPNEEDVDDDDRHEIFI